MPQVPYVPYPTTEPTTQGTSGVRVSTPPEAFGANIGRAVERFGLGLEQDSDKIWQRAVALQELQNETAARNADVQASTEMGKLHAGFSALEGVNAGPKALEKYSTDLNEVYQRVRGSLPNDDARRRYDASALSVLNRSIFNGAGHSAQQMKLAAEKSAQAIVQNDADDLYHNPTEQGLDTYLDKATSSARTVAGLRGLDANASKELENKYTSHELSHLIVGLAKREPWRAGDLLEKYRDRIHGDDIERVENSVQQAQRTVGARNISMQVNADLHDPDMEDHRGLEDRIADGREAAKKLNPKDELLPSYVDAQVTAEFNRWKQVQRDTEFENRQTIEGALVGNYGKIPVTVDELRAIPNVDAAWSSMKPSTQRHYLNVMSQIQRSGDRIPPSDSLKERQRLVGLQQSDPNAFLQEDILEYVGKTLNTNDAKFLIGQQKATLKQAAQNPNSAHAMQVMAPDLQAAGLTRAADPDGYYKFYGAIHDWMQDHIMDHKKRPTDDEILKTGRMLLQRTGAGWFSSGTALYEGPPTDDVVAEFNKRAKEIDPTAPELDARQVGRLLLRERLRVFDQPKPGARPSKPPPKSTPEVITKPLSPPNPNVPTSQ